MMEHRGGFNRHTTIKEADSTTSPENKRAIYSEHQLRALLDLKTTKCVFCRKYIPHLSAAEFFFHLRICDGATLNLLSNSSTQYSEKLCSGTSMSIKRSVRFQEDVMQKAVITLQNSSDESKTDENADSSSDNAHSPYIRKVNEARNSQRSFFSEDKKGKNGNPENDDTINDSCENATEIEVYEGRFNSEKYRQLEDKNAKRKEGLACEYKNSTVCDKSESQNSNVTECSEYEEVNADSDSDVEINPAESDDREGAENSEKASENSKQKNDRKCKNSIESQGLRKKSAQGNAKSKGKNHNRRESCNGDKEIDSKNDSIYCTEIKNTEDEIISQSVESDNTSGKDLMEIDDTENISGDEDCDNGFKESTSNENCSESHRNPIEIFTGGRQMKKIKNETNTNKRYRKYLYTKRKSEDFNPTDDENRHIQKGTHGHKIRNYGLIKGQLHFTRLSDSSGKETPCTKLHVSHDKQPMPAYSAKESGKSNQQKRKKLIKKKLRKRHSKLANYIDNCYSSSSEFDHNNQFVKLGPSWHFRLAKFQKIKKRIGCKKLDNRKHPTEKSQHPHSFKRRASKGKSIHFQQRKPFHISVKVQKNNIMQALLVPSQLLEGGKFGDVVPSKKLTYITKTKGSLKEYPQFNLTFAPLQHDHLYSIGDCSLQADFSKNLCTEDDEKEKVNDGDHVHNKTDVETWREEIKDSSNSLILMQKLEATTTTTSGSENGEANLINVFEENENDVNIFEKNGNCGENLVDIFRENENSNVSSGDMKVDNKEDESFPLPAITIQCAENMYDGVLWDDINAYDQRLEANDIIKETKVSVEIAIWTVQQLHDNRFLHFLNDDAYDEFHLSPYACVQGVDDNSDINENKHAGSSNKADQIEISEMSQSTSSPKYSAKPSMAIEVVAFPSITETNLVKHQDNTSTTSSGLPSSQPENPESPTPGVKVPLSESEPLNLLLPPQHKKSPDSVLPLQYPESPDSFISNHYPGSSDSFLPQAHQESWNSILPPSYPNLSDEFLPHQQAESLDSFVATQYPKSSASFSSPQYLESPDSFLNPHDLKSSDSFLPQKHLETSGSCILPPTQHLTSSDSHLIPKSALPSQNPETSTLALPQQYLHASHLVLPHEYPDVTAMVLPHQYPDASSVVLPRQHHDASAIVLPRQYQDASAVVYPHQHQDASVIVLPGHHLHTSQMVLPSQHQDASAIGLLHQHQDPSATVLPHPSGVSATIVPCHPDVSTMVFPYHPDVLTMILPHQQDVSTMVLPHHPDVSSIALPNHPDVSTMVLQHNSDMSAMALPHHSDASVMAWPYRQNVSAGVLAHHHSDASAVILPQNHPAPSSIVLPQHLEVSPFQESPTSRLHASHAGSVLQIHNRYPDLSGSQRYPRYTGPSTSHLHLRQQGPPARWPSQHQESSNLHLQSQQQHLSHSAQFPYPEQPTFESTPLKIAEVPPRRYVPHPRSELSTSPVLEPEYLESQRNFFRTQHQQMHFPPFPPSFNTSLQPGLEPLNAEQRQHSLFTGLPLSAIAHRRSEFQIPLNSQRYPLIPEQRYASQQYQLIAEEQHPWIPPQRYQMIPERRYPLISEQQHHGRPLAPNPYLNHVDARNDQLVINEGTPNLRGTETNNRVINDQTELSRGTRRRHAPTRGNNTRLPTGTTLVDNPHFLNPNYSDQTIQMNPTNHFHRVPTERNSRLQNSRPTNPNLLSNNNAPPRQVQVPSQKRTRRNSERLSNTDSGSEAAKMGRYDGF